jgi:hypothetical protein
MGENILQKWQVEGRSLLLMNVEARNAAICLDFVEIMNP